MFRFAKTRAIRNHTRPTVRPALESLDGRIVPAHLTVTSALDNGAAGTLRYEVGLANADAARGVSDTITFASSLRRAYIQLNSPLELTRGTHRASVTIAGSDLAGAVRLSGRSAHEVLRVDPGASLYLHFIHVDFGKAVSGGGVWNGGYLNANQCEFLDNQATNGGAIYNAGVLELANSNLNGNTASRAGGAVYTTGTMNGNGVAFNRNTAGAGSAIANTGTLTMAGGQFNYNTGSALYSRNFAAVSYSNFVGNSARYGGAIYDDGVLFISHDSFIGNRAAYRGGALFVTPYGHSNFHGSPTDQYANNYDPMGSGDGYGM